MIEQSDVTIIIPHLGKTKEQQYSLQECLKSLDETVPEMKKIIAINSVLNYEEKIKDFLIKNISLITLEEQGQCKAVNAAVATTNTPWIFITNDDMVYAPGWWEVLSNTYYDIGCVSPKLIEPRPGAPTFEQYFCGGAGGDFDKEKWLRFADEYMKAPVNRPYRRGFNFPLLIRKDIFDLVGGYDIQYDPWGSSSDTDLQCKIELAGIETYQNPGCPIYHFSQTSGTFHPDQHSYWEKNYAYFKEKWGFERPGNPNVWFSKDLIKYDQLKYQPWWKDFYKKTTSENKTKLS